VAFPLSAFSWGCITGNGNLRLTLTADKTFTKSQKLLNELACLIQKEFNLIFDEASLLTKEKQIA
jgi:hypothetical protein